jgi:hypothetical protein
VIKHLLRTFCERWKRESAPFPSSLVRFLFLALSIAFTAKEVPAVESHGDVLTVAREAEEDGRAAEHLLEHTEGFDLVAVTIVV